MATDDNLNPIQAQKYLAGMEYPAKKDELMECAKDNGAGEQVLSFFERIPDKEYSSPIEVSEEIGQLDRNQKSGSDA